MRTGIPAGHPLGTAGNTLPPGKIEDAGLHQQIDGRAWRLPSLISAEALNPPLCTPYFPWTAQEFSGLFRVFTRGPDRRGLGIRDHPGSARALSRRDAGGHPECTH